VTTKTPVPAIEGWFTLDADQPALLGTLCTSCGTYAFPRETFFCKNPDCLGREFDEVPLSRTGTIWSFTNNCFKPPPPYMSSDPFEPYAIAAVELAAEQMVVLGQLVPGTNLEDLHAGMEVELVLDPLYEDDDHTYLVWKWKPTGKSSRTSTGGTTDSEGADA